jgi:peroxiredoxin
MTQWVKGFLFVTVVSVAVLGMLASGLRAATEPPPEGGVLPQLELAVPEDAQARAYLGLSGSGKFAIPQIKARLVIVEIFNFYCTHCQREASRVNELYQAIEKNADLKDKVKVIGIGAGNSVYEVEVFKKKYNVPFPLLPDQDLSVHKSLGEVRTPYFIGVKVNPDGTNKVIYSKLGGFKDSGQFLATMLKLAGLS